MSRHGGGGVQYTNSSSCLVRAYWDYAEHDVSGKIGKQFEAYRVRRALSSGSGSTFTTGWNSLSTKSKLRGRGKALSLRIETSPGMDCHILSWGISYTGGSDV